MVKFRFVTPGRIAAKKRRHPVDVAVGALLAQRREAAGITQLRLATLLKTQRTSVVRAEGGERHIEVAEVVALLQLLDADPAEFFAELVERLHAAQPQPSRTRPRASLRRALRRRRPR